MDELENLDQLENKGQQSTNINISNVYPVRTGGFGITPQIKTYLTTLNINDLESDINFYEVLSKDKGWPVSHIIQREIDQDRVNSITKKYLLGEGRIVKYFPPLIVALLPREVNGNFAQKFSFNPDQTSDSKELIFEKSKYRGNDKFKEILLQKNNDSLVEGIYLFNTSPIFEHNILCWDKSKFYAVVIDGQHRLDALIKAKKENPDYANAIQDVIFLDTSKLNNSNPDNSPIEILRTIFIDINTNAKSVGLVRRILMDDKDLASLCVQSLIESVNKDGTAKSQDSFIQPNIIDWYGESLKHELPHVTGILTLYQIISDELVGSRLISIDDHRDQNKIQYFMETLNNYFFVDTSIKKEAEYSDISTLENSFKEYLKLKTINREIFAEQLTEGELDSLLFNYDYRVLEVAQENFNKFFLRSIVRIFSDFLPYKLTIEILDKLNAFNPESNLYKALLTSRTKLASDKNLRDNYISARQQLQQQVGDKYFLFFSVVGQKGLFNIYFNRLLNEFKYGTTEDFILKLQSVYINQLNGILQLLEEDKFFLFGKEDIIIPEDLLPDKLNEYGTLSSSFWEGILFEDKRIIYNSQGVKAIADVIRLIIDCFNNAKLKKDKKVMDNYSFRYANNRTKRLLKKRFGNRSDEEYEVIAAEILKLKKDFIINKIYKLTEEKNGEE